MQTSEFYISKVELEKDIESTNQKQEEFSSKNSVDSNDEKKANTSSFFQSARDSRQIAKLYYITDNTTERASSKRAEEEKYFELGKKKNTQQERASIQAEEKIYDKEKLKREWLKDLPRCSSESREPNRKSGHDHQDRLRLNSEERRAGYRRRLARVITVPDKG